VNQVSDVLDVAMRRFQPGLPLAVGFSGGADSTALLLACALRWPGKIHAWHIHHGLQSAADDFAAHCHTVCQRWDVPLTVQRVNARHTHGQSPEEAARQARYAAFMDLARQSSHIRHVALAQHADDQAETLLLALTRGAGVAGLAAMPECWQRGGITWYRPLLQVAGADVRTWLRARGQSWIEDPSNSEQKYTRNRIRAQLLPVLQQAFPQFRATFARSSRHCADAAELLHELAAADLTHIGCPPRISALQSLSRARQGNVLRHWLRSLHGTTPSTAQLDQLLRQIAACRTRGHHIHLKIGSGFICRHGERIGWIAGAVPL